MTKLWSLTNFMEAVKKISDYLASEFVTSPEEKNKFIARVADSVHNIEKTLAHRHEELKDLPSAVQTFRGAEQALVIGHNFHPTPKSRDEFSDEDFLKYSSEMGEGFKLNWFLVRPEILFTQEAASFTTKDTASAMFRQSFAVNAEALKWLRENWQPLPVHPWQREQLLQRPDVQNYLAQKQLIDFGASPEDWFATTSTRSIYSPAAPYMLKFSLSVRLTNSIRHLLPAEVVRGLQVCDVLATAQGQKFQQEHPEFQILLEPCFAALKTADGRPMTESVVVWRENPFHQPMRHPVVPLAVLAQDSLYDEKNLIQQYIEQAAQSKRTSLAHAAEVWFEKYLQMAVRPLVMAQAQYGIMMGAHQQNMLIEITEGLPSKSYFRDCQGTGYSQQGFEQFAHLVKLIDEKNGNILDEKTGSYLFSYYLIINSTFNVISAIANLNWITEEVLLGHLRAELLSIRDTHPADISCLAYLLFEPQILQKGNFLCCFKNINENTAANPLAIYNPIRNPLFQEQTHA